MIYFQCALCLLLGCVWHHVGCFGSLFRRRYKTYVLYARFCLVFCIRCTAYYVWPVSLGVNVDDFTCALHDIGDCELIYPNVESF